MHNIFIELFGTLQEIVECYFIFFFLFHNKQNKLMKEKEEEFIYDLLYSRFTFWTCKCY